MAKDMIRKYNHTHTHAHTHTHTHTHMHAHTHTHACTHTSVFSVRLSLHQCTANATFLSVADPTFESPSWEVPGHRPNSAELEAHGAVDEQQIRHHRALTYTDSADSQPVRSIATPGATHAQLTVFVSS